MKTINEYEEQIAKLEDDLYLLRYRFLNLLPIEFIRALGPDGDTPYEAHSWVKRATERVVEMVEFSLPEFRAKCPLCSSATNFEYLFAYSREGLKNHLSGGFGKQQCGFMEIAYKQALSHYRKHNFFEKTPEQLKRMKIETLYLYSPYREAALIDDGNRFKIPMDALIENVAEYEAHLLELGFNLKSEGQVRSYTLEHDKKIVYADPRQMSYEKSFDVYALPLGGKDKPSIKKYVSMNQRWKVDLPGKLLKEIEKVVFD